MQYELDFLFYFSRQFQGLFCAMPKFLRNKQKYMLSISCALDRRKFDDMIFFWIHQSFFSSKVGKRLTEGVSIFRSIE